MLKVILYTQIDDPNLIEIKEYLIALKDQYPHRLFIIDISQDPGLTAEFGPKAPLLDIGLYRLIWPFSHTEIEMACRKAADRLKKAQSTDDTAVIDRMTNPPYMTKSDRFSLWVSKNYLKFLNSLTFLYVFLAFLAPIFMKLGWEGTGTSIYKFYRPFCHQLAYRSFFLFGEQPYYPRELTGMETVKFYEEVTGNNPYDLNSARELLGDEYLGYKLALCQRDIAIYVSIFLFGMLFMLCGRKIKPLPWYLWLIIGLGPIGLDGFSQLLSQSGFALFNWLPIRESTPLLRALTGSLFGLATAWFGFPYLEESVQENRYKMQVKKAVTNQLSRQ
jgi:uncharacterized membrane protein